VAAGMWSARTRATKDANLVAAGQSGMKPPGNDSPGQSQEKGLLEARARRIV
jgi:hypothetical protein